MGDDLLKQGLRQGQRSGDWRSIFEILDACMIALSVVLAIWAERMADFSIMLIALGLICGAVTVRLTLLRPERTRSQYVNETARAPEKDVGTDKPETSDTEDRALVQIVETQRRVLVALRDSASRTNARLGNSQQTVFGAGFSLHEPSAANHAEMLAVCLDQMAQIERAVAILTDHGNEPRQTT